MDFCICIQIGCSNQYSQEGNQAFICPRCHNGAVFQVKETRCLEVCCIPIMPMGTEHLYQCNICQWQASQNGPAPPLAGQNYAPPPQNFQQGYQQNPGMQPQPYQPGYNPQYVGGPGSVGQGGYRV